MVYDKLVRDRIPEIIEGTGQICRWRVLSDEEYIGRLDQKMNEELAEYLESHSPEELADLLEVMRAAAMAHGGAPEVCGGMSGDPVDGLDERLGGAVSAYLEDHSAEKLVELYALVCASAIACGSSPAEVEAIRAEKACRRGAFSRKLLLTGVYDPQEEI